MPSVPDDEDQAGAFDTLLDAMTAKTSPRDADVHMLRQAFYKEGVVGRRRAAAIFHANRLMQTAHEGWIAFYLEALTAAFIKAGREGQVINAGAEATLLAWLGDDVTIPNPGERRLTLRLLLMARNEPEELERRVLLAVFENLLHEDIRWIGGQKRKPGIIDADDIQLIRRLLYRGVKASRPGARKAAILFLFRLDQHAERFTDPEGWRQLLTESLARYACQDMPADCDLDNLSGSFFSAEMKALLYTERTLADAASLMARTLSEARASIQTK